MENLTALISLLHEKKRLIERILVILEEEQRLIASLDAQGLTENTRIKEEAFLTLQQLVREIGKTLSSTAQEMGLAAGATLTPVIAQAPAREAGELKRLQRSLSELADKFRRHSELNSGIIKASLSLVGRSLAFLTQACRIRGKGVYGQQGKMLCSGAGHRIISEDI